VLRPSVRLSLRPSKTCVQSKLLNIGSHKQGDRGPRLVFWRQGPVWVRGRCRISPPRFLAECCKRQLNQGRFVMLYFRLSTFFWFVLSLFICIFLYCFVCQYRPPISVKWLHAKTTSEMTYTVSSGALNCNYSNQPIWWNSNGLGSLPSGTPNARGTRGHIAKASLLGLVRHRPMEKGYDVCI